MRAELGPHRQTTPGVRWWPEVLLLAAAAGSLAWAWTNDDLTGQARIMRSYGIIALTGGGSALWLLLLSRLPWRRRLGILAAGAVAGTLFVGLFRVRGVTGNLVPLLTWRWTDDTQQPSSADAPLAELDRTVRPEIPGPAGRYSFPQFLGPLRNATLPDIQLSRDWELTPPVELWRRPIGAGWSGFAVTDGLAVTQEQDGADEMVTAFDLTTGRLRWSHRYTARYSTTIGGTGPRATPTIVDGAVYTLGATGVLSALDLADGSLRWSRDVVADHHAVVPDWGKSSSPLVADNRVIISAGGPEGHSLVAYDAITGSDLWHAGSDASGYASPVVMNLAGSRQIVIFNKRSVAGHDLADGHLLWQWDWPAGQPNVAQPVAIDDHRILLSSGYGIGAKLLDVQHLADGERRADGQRRADGGWKIELVWESPRLKAKFANYVLHDGFIYGLDDGILACLDPETGERCWKRGRYGHGQLLLVGDLLLVQAESGDVVLVDPNPQELRELGRFNALDGKTWNSPALAGPYLLVRNDRQVACYELPLA